MKRFETKNRIAGVQFGSKGELKYIMFGQTIYLYNTNVLFMFPYIPDYKVLFDIQSMTALPIMEHEHDGEYWEITEEQFLSLTQNDPEPTAYQNNEEFYIVGANNRVAWFNPQTLSWEELEKRCDLSDAKQLPVEEVLAITEGMQQAAYQKAKEEGTLPEIDLFGKN